MLRRLGATLAFAKGIAPSPRVLTHARLGRAWASGLSIAAILVGFAGVLNGLSEPTLTGLSLESPGGHVLLVDPGSLAYATGIRPGQLVISHTMSSDPGGWSVVTRDGDIEHGVFEAAATATLRLGLVPAGAAGILGLFGLAAAGRHRRRAEGLASLGLFAASIPLAALHDQISGPLIGAASLLVTSLWLGRWAASKPVGAALLGAAIAIIAVWIGARSLAPDTLPTIEDVRFDSTVVLALAISTLGLGVTPVSVARRAATLRYVDVLAAAALLIGLAAIALLAAPPPWVSLLLIVVFGLGYRRLRRSIGEWIDRLIFAEQRERAGIESAESERARISRELHDDPLQAIAGVILSLENQPETAKERETLRTVASQLRNIATALHPPVLDDLGLIPAVESLFADQGPVRVHLELRNEAGFSQTARPPFEVELASYRIIQEAITNALRHSGCHRILVRGHVSPLAVAIDVVDDGRGIVDRELEVAIREGHLGVASMRRRAEAIDARLAHVRASAPASGTTVSLRWSA